MIHKLEGLGAMWILCPICVAFEKIPFEFVDIRLDTCNPQEHVLCADYRDCLVARVDTEVKLVQHLNS